MLAPDRDVAVPSPPGADVAERQEYCGASRLPSGFLVCLPLLAYILRYSM
jgi:hypothetical protein